MRLTIRRVGGQLPTFQPTKVVDENEIDPATCEIARDFVRSAPPRQSGPPDTFRPDTFRYVFELEEDGQTTTASAAFAEIPEALRLLLPSPAARRRQ
jgi:hypothetical protein